jgi:hypothetical protein
MMFSLLATKFRIKAALAVAVIYTLCALAPSVALAFPGSMAAHCLSQDIAGTSPHEHGVTAHVHADGVTHHHPGVGAHKTSGDANKGHGAECCGLFSVVAIPPTAMLIFGSAHLVPVTFSALQEFVYGRGPERINRPPIS